MVEKTNRISVESELRDVKKQLAQAQKLLSHYRQIVSDFNKQRTTTTTFPEYAAGATPKSKQYHKPILINYNVNCDVERIYLLKNEM